MIIKRNRKNRTEGYIRRVRSIYVEFLTMLLAIICIFSVSDNVQADESNNINLLCIGDSTSQGFLLEDYDYTYYGLGDAGSADSYPFLLSDYIEEQTGRNVELFQYTLAGMRPCDLRAYIDPDYTEEKWDDGCATNIAKYSEAFMGKFNTSDASACFTYAIANADIITLDLGANNIAGYLKNRLLTYLGTMDAGDYNDSLEDIRVELESCESGAYDKINEIGDRFEAGLDGMSNNEIFDEVLVESIRYGLGRFIIDYKICLQRIFELNPDVQLITVGLYNAMDDLYLQSGTNIIDFGTLCQDIFDSFNDYIQGGEMIGMNNYYSNYYRYSDVGNVDMFIDELANGITDGSLNGTVKDGTRNVIVRNLFAQVGENTIGPLLMDGIAANIAERASGISGLLNMFGSSAEAVGEAASQNIMNVFGFDGVDTYLSAENVVYSYQNCPADYSDQQMVSALSRVLFGQSDSEFAYYCVSEAFNVILTNMCKASAKDVLNADEMFELLERDDYQSVVASAFSDFDAVDDGTQSVMNLYMRFGGLNNMGMHPSLAGCLSKYDAVVEGYNSTVAANGGDLMDYSLRINDAEALSFGNKINVNWQVAGNAEGFEIYAMYADGSEYKTVMVKKSYCNFKNLNNGERYSFKVRAYKTENGSKIFGKWSDTLSAVPYDDSIKNLKAESYDQKIRLSWDKVEDADGYLIYAMYADGSKYKTYNTVRNSCNFTKLINGSKYQFKVKEYKKGLTGDNYYGEYSEVVAAIPRLDAVSGFKVLPFDKKVNVSWNALDKADGYYINVKYSDGTVYKNYSTKKTSCNFNNLSNSKTYKFRVRAYTLNSKGNKVYGKYCSYISANPYYDKVTQLKAVGAANKVSLSWKAVNQADGYNIYAMYSDGTKYKTYNTIKTTCNFNKLKTGSTYKFKVREYKKNAAGKKVYGTYSTVVKARAK